MQGTIHFSWKGISYTRLSQNTILEILFFHLDLPRRLCPKKSTIMMILFIQAPTKDYTLHLVIDS